MFMSIIIQLQIINGINHIKSREKVISSFLIAQNMTHLKSSQTNTVTSEVQGQMVITIQTQTDHEGGPRKKNIGGGGKELW